MSGSETLLEFLAMALELHNERETERAEKEGSDYVPKKMRIHLFIPNQELLDSSEPLEVEFVDEDTLTIGVNKPSKVVDKDLLVVISLKNAPFLAICGEDFQKALLWRIHRD